MTESAKQNVVVRAFESGDIERVTALSEQLGYPATVERMRERSQRLGKDADHAVFVATSDRHGVIGWIHVFVRRMLLNDGETEIGGLIVGDRFRNRNVGSALVERGEAWSRERGCSGIRVRSNILRDEAHGFYVRMGYESTKTQCVYRKRF